VRSQPHAVTISVAEDLTEGDKRLDIASRADDLDDDVEFGGWCLAGEATQAWRDVRRR